MEDKPLLQQYLLVDSIYFSSAQEEIYRQVVNIK